MSIIFQPRAAHSADPTLSPDAIKLAVSSYFGRQDCGYLHTVDNLVAQHPKQHSDCRISYCLPIAAHEEGGNLSRTLQGMTSQSIRPDEVEILVLANHPKQDPLTGQRVKENSLSEIQAFQAANPKFHVSYAYHVFEQPVPIGLVRSLATDIALKRYFNRGDFTRELLLASADGDSHGYHKDHAKNIITLRGQNSRIGMIGCAALYSPVDCASNPLLLFNTWFEEETIKWLETRFSKTFFRGSGSNQVFSATAYCQVNGYNRDLTQREDSDLKNRIKAGYEIISGGEKSLCYTQARRALYALQFDHAICEQWRDFDFSAFNPEVRLAKEISEARFESDLQDPNFGVRAANVITRTLEMSDQQHREVNSTSFFSLYDHTLMPELLAYLSSKMGFSYQLTGDSKLFISSDIKLQRALLEKRDLYIGEWEERTGLVYSSFF